MQFLKTKNEKIKRFIDFHGNSKHKTLSLVNVFKYCGKHGFLFNEG